MGASNSGGGKPMSFYALKAKVDEQNKPFFAQTEKVEGTWKETGTFDTLTGMLSGAKIEEKDLGTHGKKKFFMLYLEDDNGISKVQMSHNAITYSIINSLASCADTISDFSIQVYRAKPEVRENKTYHNGRAAVKRGKEKTEWHINPKDAPKKVPVMVGDEPFLQDGKQVYDDKKVREFWETLFTTAIISKVGEWNATPKPEASATTTANTTTTTQEDDLPF